MLGQAPLPEGNLDLPVLPSVRRPSAWAALRSCLSVQDRYESVALHDGPRHFTLTPQAARWFVRGGVGVVLPGTSATGSP